VKTLVRSSVNWIPYRFRDYVRRVPLLKRFQSWVVNCFLSEDIFIHRIGGGPAAGATFKISLPADKAIWAGTYERQFAEELVKHVSRGSICYDIGGYRGFMSAAMALHGASRVIVFEPFFRNQEALRDLCTLNPSFPIDVLPIAVGANDGSALFSVMRDPSMGKLETSPFQVHDPGQEKVPICTRRLDSLVEKKEIPPPSLIKIDVEGAELDVLRGARAVLTTYRPCIFVEVHSGRLEELCTRALTELAYDCIRLEPSEPPEETPRHLVCHARS
jgi:FkbM family methyltransferase